GPLPRPRRAPPGEDRNGRQLHRPGGGRRGGRCGREQPQPPGHPALPQQEPEVQAGALPGRPGLVRHPHEVRERHHVRALLQDQGREQHHQHRAGVAARAAEFEGPVMTRHSLAGLLALAGLAAPLWADVGDPQVRTDHPWYPGELACSTFERLFATQAEHYARVTGVTPRTEEQKALASWFWRNTHYFHAEDGRQDLFGRGFAHADNWTREYWTGLLGFGFALCGTTHAQWSAEMQKL